MDRKRKFLTALGGLGAGVANGLLGAGGGMLLVPLLRKAGVTETQAHATSVAVILPLCLLSAVLYLLRGDVTVSAALPWLPWTLGGSLLGAWLLPRCRSQWLRRGFGLLMLWAAVRMLL